MLAILLAAGFVLDAPPDISPLTEESLSQVMLDLSMDFIKERDVDPIAFDYDPDYSKKKEIAEAEEGMRAEMYYVPGAHIQVQGRIHDYDRAPISTVTQDGQEIQANYPRENVLPQLETPRFISQQRGFYIDKHAVFNREYAAFLKETGHPPPSHWPKGKIPTGQDEAAVVNVSYGDALAYAAWAGKRLPKASEFDRTYRKFPNFRRYSPQREWTSTIANPGELPVKYYLYGGSPSIPDKADGYTGFRCAMDGR